ncbi:hypothetical protein ACFQ9X_01875 [Catenulispora yoronensis]
MRWVGSALLATALLLTVPCGAPRGAQFEQLLDGVRAGGVTAVQIHVDGGTVSTVWHEGPLRWYRADGPYDAQRQLLAAATAPGAEGRLTFTSPEPHRVWLQAVDDADEPTWLAVPAVLLYLLAFLVMLMTREHPYANRWAWFWLFVVGGIGPILLLLKEPVPLRIGRRRRASRAGEASQASRPPRPARPARPPLTGGVGLALALVWATGLALAGSLLSAVAG